MRWMAAAVAALCLVSAGASADEAISTQILLRTGRTNIGQPIHYPRRGEAEITTMIVTIPPGGATALHKHPVPIVGYILEGELEVRAAGGKVNRYKAGDSVVEAFGVAHRGTNIGDGPCRILVTVIGVKGQPYAVPVKP
ncbi:MAG TPA: cupin domain-containing protein [Stellaceae bacterium]|nr:cupin domain-containing protein [Stellaceae bacterium]